MVSSGKVLGDLQSLKAVGSKYTGEIGGLSSSWQGPSHDSFVSKSEAFISEYMSALESQMSSFATACDLYEQYKVAKQNREISENNHRKALAHDDRASANRFSADIHKYAKIEQETKRQIEENLKSVTATKLNATANKVDTITLPEAAIKGTDSNEAEQEALRASLVSAPHYGSSSYSGGSGGSVSYSGGGATYSVGSSGSTSSSTSSSTDSSPAPVVTGSANVNGNIIDTSKPVGTGAKYNLTDSELAYLAYVAKREQGSVEGAKLELSLMANLYEKNKSKYSSVIDYVQHSGWFGGGSTRSYSYPGDSYVAAAREVISEGNRYLASNVVEHDCISDITQISTGSKNDRSNYVPGKTIIYNKYGAKYVFVGFAPNGGDPFGYLA